MAASDQFCTSAFFVIMQVPSSYTIFRRELTSHMYGPTAHFFSGTLSALLWILFYPVLISLLTFWTYGFPIETFEGFLNFLVIMIVSAYAGVCFGKFMTSFIHQENTAQIGLMQGLIIYYLGGGLVYNASSGSNWLGDLLQYISPLRVINELMFRRMLEGRGNIKDAVILRFQFQS